MKLFLAALSTLAVAGLASPAHAGGYISVGIGADAGLAGDMATHFTADHDDAGSGRIAIGQRVGNIAVEASLYGAALQSTTGLGDGADYATATAGVALKYYIPLSGRLEGYGKGGLDKTWLVADGDMRASGYAGRGYNFGGGIQFTFETGLLGSAAVWLDYTHQEFELREDGMRDLDGGTRLLTLGVSLGF